MDGFQSMQPQYAHAGERASITTCSASARWNDPIAERASVAAHPYVASGTAHTAAMVFGVAGSGSGVIANSSRKKFVTDRNRRATSASLSGAGGGRPGIASIS